MASQNPIFILMGLYLLCSLPLFNKIYEKAEIVIDEMFHIPQAQAYCDGRYDVWDPKITTLPGLYIAVQIVNPILKCSRYFLRIFNLAASTVNMGLFYVILNIVYGCGVSKQNLALQALSLALLPPLYFFSHVFYTDTVSLMFLLLYSISVIKRAKYYIIIFGIASIGTRQTNVVWVFMMWSQKLMEVFIKASRVYSNEYIQNNRQRGKGQYELNPKILKRLYSGQDLNIAANFHFERMAINLLCNHHINYDAMHLLDMILPVVLFGLFVLMNGSIVVGDKEAHTMTVNFPQLLYFLLFYGFFGLPIVLSQIKSTLSFMNANKRIVFVIMLGSLLAVHFNTVVHPYLLADNRHYTFYIWNRWFGKFPEAIFLTIPAYVFLACSFFDNLVHQNCISFLLAYFACLIPGLCFQRLLELRYFIIPYVIARLRFPRMSTRLLVCELIWYLIINAAFFYVFFTKEIKWDNFEEPQRIIW